MKITYTFFSFPEKGTYFSIVLSPVANYFGPLLRFGVENHILHLKLNFVLSQDTTQVSLGKDIAIPKSNVLRLILQVTKMQPFLYASKM